MKTLLVNIKKWWRKNFRDKQNRFNTGRAGKFAALFALCAFCLFLGVVFIFSTIYFVFKSTFLISSADLKTLLFAAATVFTATLPLIADYRAKDFAKTNEINPEETDK